MYVFICTAVSSCLNNIDLQQVHWQLLTDGWHLRLFGPVYRSGEGSKVQHNQFPWQLHRISALQFVAKQTLPQNTFFVIIIMIWLGGCIHYPGLDPYWFMAAWPLVYLCLYFSWTFHLFRWRHTPHVAIRMHNGAICFPTHEYRRMKDAWSAWQTHGGGHGKHNKKANKQASK